MAKKPLEPIKLAINGPNGELKAVEVVPFSKTKTTAVVHNGRFLTVTHIPTGWAMFTSGPIIAYAKRRRIGASDGPKVRKALKVLSEAYEKYIADKPEGWIDESVFIFGESPQKDTYDRMKEAVEFAWEETKKHLDEALSPAKIYAPINMSKEKTA